MKLELGQLGSGGVVYDIKPYDLPPNVFNKSMNVEFDGFSAKPMVKDSAALAPLPETFEPLALFQGTVYGGLVVWIAACADKIFLYDITDWVDVTPLGMASATHWNIFSYNGYTIIQSDNNPPYYVDIYDYLSSIKEIPNWPVGFRVTHLGSYLGFLVGLGLTSSDGFFDKQLVLWSDVAELGSLPSNWRFDDPTSRAGFFAMQDNEDFITALPLANSYIIYRSKSIYEMRFIGGVSIFSFERRDRNTKLLNKKSVCEVDGMHFFIGNDSFYFYDGITKRPVGKGLVSDTLFATWNPASVEVVSDPDNLKIWIYYSETSETANIGMCFRYKQGFFFPRETPSTFTVGKGLVPSAGEIRRWQDLTETWAEWEDTWELRYNSQDLNQLVRASADGFVTTPRTGEPMYAYLERNFIAFAQTDQADAITVNRSLRKFIRQTWPELNTGQLLISFGTSKTATDPVSWFDYKLFDSDTQLKQDWAFSTKYISLRMTNTSIDEVAPYFELTGYSLEVEPGGRF